MSVSIRCANLEDVAPFLLPWTRPSVKQTFSTMRYLSPLQGNEYSDSLTDHQHVTRVSHELQDAAFWSSIYLLLQLRKTWVPGINIMHVGPECTTFSRTSVQAISSSMSPYNKGPWLKRQQLSPRSPPAVYANAASKSKRNSLRRGRRNHLPLAGKQETHSLDHTK